MFDTLDYFYDKQQYRYLEQIVRAFSGFKYMTGSRNGQPPSLQIVPARMAATNRMVASILRNLSENTVLTTPMITVWQTGISYNNDMANNRNHVDTRQIVERAIDPNTGQYTSARGRSYTLHRLMPVPMFMNIQVDIWTSNLDQKYQLEEQILTIMVPSFDIQNSDNGLDWSALTTVTVEDIVHTSRTIPIGTNDEIDIMTITLKMPFHLNPPAILKQQNLIEQVVTNVNDTAGEVGVVQDSHPGTRLSQTITTPGNYRINVDKGVITLLGDYDLNPGDGLETPPQDWLPVLNHYGQLRPATSQLKLMKTEDIEGPAVVGTIQIDSNDPTKLLWQIDPDSLPSNTLTPVNALIEPMRTFPGEGLPTAISGVRYLILQDIGPSQAWPGLTAKTNDIIEYNGSTWGVAFSSTTATAPQYVLNLHTNSQLRFTGEDWELAIDGVYHPGYWRLEL